MTAVDSASTIDSERDGAAEAQSTGPMKSDTGANRLDGPIKSAAERDWEDEGGTVQGAAS